MDLTKHLASSTSLVGMFIREMSPLLTVIDGEWRDAAESARTLGFDEISALPTLAVRPETVDAGLAGSAFDFRARMMLSAAASGPAVPTFAVTATAERFPGADPAELVLFADVFDEACTILERGGTAEDLDRAAVLLSWCEGASRFMSRSIRDRGLGLRLQDESFGGTFAARVPDELLADLAAMRAASEPAIGEWAAAIAAGTRWSPNPHLSGRKIVIAVPDWTVGDTLVECKAIEPVTPSRLRAALLQLLGYALLDFDDSNHIREVAIFLPRRGVIRTWSLNQLLGGDADTLLPPLRAQFQDEFGEHWWIRDWDPGDWVPGTVHPTGGFDEYVGEPYQHKWLRNGALHREDGPALISGNHAWWYLDDVLVYAEEFDNTKLWYRNNELHRDDGPAVIQADRTQVWYRDGRVHREDGPAVIFRHGNVEWWLDDVRYETKESWEKARAAAEA